MRTASLRSVAAGARWSWPCPGALPLLILLLLVAGPLPGQAAGRSAARPSVPAAAAAAAVAQLTQRQADPDIRSGRGRSGRAQRADAPPIASRPGSRASGGRGPVQCAKCHADRQFLAGKAQGARGDSVLFVPDTLLIDSRHRTLVCADCHAGYNDGYPHASVTTVAIACAQCHASQGAAYDRSIHARNFEKKGDAPTCTSCHSAHRVLGMDDPRSPTYPLNVAQLCGSCHDKKSILDAYFDQPADSTARTAVGDFRRSVHGLAMTKAGLTVSATCSDCHDAHRILPVDSTESTLNRSHVKATCGACHAGVLATFDSSAHGRALVSGDTTKNGKHAPVCIECHGGHKIVDATDPLWFSGVVLECGSCHPRLLDSYFESYHGKATTLGSGIAAKCSDCHTAHAMRPPDDTLSSVNSAHLVDTCGGCHAGANASFVMYKPHADPRDSERNPELHTVWILMTSLLIGVFGFFGLHSLLWFLRLRSIRHDPPGGDPAPDPGNGGGDSGPLPVVPPPPVAPPPSVALDDTSGATHAPPSPETPSTPSPSPREPESSASDTPGNSRGEGPPRSASDGEHA